MAGFGAFHGLNPAMGWLFALSLGLQQQRERAIGLSLVPIAIGHAGALALVALPIIALRSAIPIDALRLAAAVLLLAFGLWKLGRWYRHPRWVGMRVGMGELLWWSFLMATAHGAGLMVAPTLVALAATSGAAVILGVGVHTLAMLVVMAVVAWIVYRKLGLAVLRTGWVNFDLIWALALLVVGGLALVLWAFHLWR